MSPGRWEDAERAEYTLSAEAAAVHLSTIFHSFSAGHGVPVFRTNRICPATPRHPQNLSYKPPLESDSQFALELTAIFRLANPNDAFHSGRSFSSRRKP